MKNYPENPHPWATDRHVLEDTKNRDIKIVILVLLPVRNP